MEKFKAVEKEMKTKAYSKEGLQAAAKLDPKEREKAETCEFLSNMVDALERQIEQVEAETEQLSATVKKGKKDTSKADRIAELERTTERHKFHQSKLELIWRSLENGGLESDQVRELEEEIRYYVENNGEVDFMENDTIYDDLDLQEEEDLFGMPADGDRLSSQDAQSLAGDLDDLRQPSISGKPKSTSISEASSAAVRRPSTQLKSPLPVLATLHTALPTTSNGPSIPAAKPAPLPTRAPGEPLKYASAAAAAAASDKNGLGLTALPPPANTTTSIPVSNGPSPVVAAALTRAPPSVSPASVHPQPAIAQSPQVSKSATFAAQNGSSPAADLRLLTSEASETRKSSPTDEESKKRIDVEKVPEDTIPPSTPALTNGDTHSEVEDEDAVYHLPSSLSDLLESFEATKSSAFQPLSNPTAQRLFMASGKSYPDSVDAERPQHYRPQNLYPYTPTHYPQEPLSIFDDARLYARCDTDTLFYSFYYKQGTYQQYSAAKALKGQSWRFHKQYQTWFQRHEEPKSITEDYEQGTYRFFDYESTWYVQPVIY
jgi:CCR4-NOT transcription complex subunit 3